MDKKEARRLVIRQLVRERRVSMAVAAHVYNCMPRNTQKRLRERESK